MNAYPLPNSLAMLKSFPLTHKLVAMLSSSNTSTRESEPQVAMLRSLQMQHSCLIILNYSMKTAVVR